MSAAEGSPTPRLEMAGIVKRFGATVALDGVDLAVAPGEVHALVGENGAGKSTLMKILSGALRPDAGAIAIDGEPFRPSGPLAARRAGVTMIYQELSIAAHLSVAENILLGIEPTRGPLLKRAEMRRRAREALAALQHEAIDPDTTAGELPVASQQIVEIARALAAGCRILVLDEPTSSLTQEDAARLFELIGRLRDEGQAIVYISHFLEEVKAIADRVTVLRDGKAVGVADTAAIDTDEIVHLMVGRRVDQMFPRSPREPGEALLAVDGLRAEDDKPEEASLELRRGEVLGIAGLVGSGRSELVRAIFGLREVRGGSVRVGSTVGPASPHRRWRQGVGLLSEDRKRDGLALTMSLADNMTLSDMGRFGTAGLVFPSRQRQASMEWIARLAIRCRSVWQQVLDLSGGNQQKVALARLLLHDVDVMLLDEPTRGIDVGSKATIYEIVDAMARGDAEAGVTPKAILVVSSYLPELMGICDRIAVMCRGRLGEARPVEQWTEHSLMLEATG